MATRADTMRRVRALLAKENAPGTTPEEVSAALALAARLLEREGLTRAALEIEGTAEEAEEETRAFADPLFTASRAATWRTRLGSILAAAFGCAQYRSGASLMLVGKPSDAETVRYLFAYCAREIERLARERCAGEGRTYANNFRIGCTDAIADAIRVEQEAERAAQRAAAAANTRALAVVDSAIAKLAQRTAIAGTHMYANVPGLRKVSVRFNSDPGGRNAGRSAGAGIYPGGRGKGVGLGSGPRGRIGSGS